MRAGGDGVGLVGADPALEQAMSTPPCRDPLGVLLFNMGGPATLDEVEPFLVEVFSDRDVIELPFGRALQPLFARVLARARARSVRRNYALIGGGSPLLRHTVAQARALQRRLDGGPLGGRARVFIAMRYTAPTAADALAAMSAAAVRQVVTVPLYPHWSRATTGSFHRALQRALEAGKDDGPAVEVTHIRSYFDDPLYLDALAATVRLGFETIPPDARRDTVVLFSAHGLPQTLVDAGDPYVEQIEATRRGVVERAALGNRHLLGYQSRTGPVRWIGPGTEELLDRLGLEGVRSVLVVPLSFVSEHIETLYEVDILLRERALARGITLYRRTPTLQTHPLFVECLARLVERSVDSRSAA